MYPEEPEEKPLDLTPEDQVFFVETILNPPNPNEALRRIMDPERS